MERNGVSHPHVLEPIVLSMAKGRGEGNCVSLVGALEPILFLYGDRERWDRTVFIPPALVQ